MSFKATAALSEYRTMGLQGVVEQASRHELVRMLMDGGLDRIAAARGQMQRGDYAAKATSISRAIGIIDGLRASLDADAGGDIAQNLDKLYDYMVRRLALANLNNDVEPLDEVRELLAQIRDAWLEVGARTAETTPEALAV